MATIKRELIFTLFSGISEQLEEDVFGKRRNDKETRDRIIGLLDHILDFIHTSDDRRAVVAAVRTFRAWKLFLMDRFAYVFARDIKAAERANARRAPGPYPLTLRRAVIRQKRKAASVVSRTPDFANLVEIDRQHPLYRLCTLSDRNINEGEFEPARRGLIEVCDTVRALPGPTPLDLYFHSWALHLKGNIHVYTRDYRLAGEKYRESFEIKKLLRDRAKLSRLQTSIKIAMNEIGSDASRSFRELTSICQETDDRKLLLRNRERVLNMRTDCSRYLGTMCLYAEHRKQARKHVNAAIDSAALAHNHVGLVKSLVLARMIDQARAIAEVEAALAEVPDSLRTRPGLRIMRSSAFRGVVAVFDRELAEGLPQLFDENGIAPLTGVY